MAREGESSREDRTWRPSIGALLSIGFGTLVLSAVSSVLWIALDTARENTFTLTRDAAEQTVATIIDKVDSHLGAAQHQLDFLADLVAKGEVDTTDEAAFAQVILGSLSAEPAITGVAFVRPNLDALRVGRMGGKILRLSSSWKHRPEIAEMVEGQRGRTTVDWIGVIWAEDLAEPQVAVNRSLYRNGEFLGVLATVISVRGLSQFLAALNENYGTHSFILQDRHQVLAHPELVGGLPKGLDLDNPLPQIHDLADRYLPQIWDPVIDHMPELLQGTSIEGHVVSGDDDDLIFLYRKITRFGEAPWIFGTYYRASEVNLALQRLVLAGLSGLAILVAAVLLALLLGRAISRPVGRLADASTAIRNLDFRSVKPLQRSFVKEIDSAAVAYNAMLNGLRWFETYVPRSLVLRLLQRGDQILDSEERQVTVIFTDIAGFTRISTKMDAAALAEFLNEHFALLAASIEAEGGTLDKYIGDSVMAFWGAPGDQPDHAARACRAALNAAASIAEDNARRAEAGLAPVRIRIGLHSGGAVVGNIGAPGRVNYTLIGDTVNIAQRLEGLGKEFMIDESAFILISGETRALLDETFEVEALGDHQLRGRTMSTEVFRLTAHTSS